MLSTVTTVPPGNLGAGSTGSPGGSSSNLVGGSVNLGGGSVNLGGGSGSTSTYDTELNGVLKRAPVRPIIVENKGNIYIYIYIYMCVCVCVCVF